MATPITQMPKPDAGQYSGERKLFLVPSFMMPPTLPEDGQALLDGYWSEVRDHVGSLSRSLGKVSRVYHELVSEGGDAGIEMLEQVNPRGSSFIKSLCQAGATLEGLEDRALLEESMDWQRCLSIGLMSEKVMQLAMDGFREASEGRSRRMIERIDETLGENEAGVVCIREDHGLQFPPSLKIFYVAPRSMDALKRWVEEQMRAAAAPPADEPGGGESPE